MEARLTTFGTIVVGIDNSPESNTAIEWARAVAGPDDRIVLLHAWQLPVVTGYDMVVTVEESMVDGPVVAVRARWRGTNTGPMMGRPPTGKKVDVTLTNYLKSIVSVLLTIAQLGAAMARFTSGHTDVRAPFTSASAMGGSLGFFMMSTSASFAS